MRRVSIAIVAAICILRPMSGSAGEMTFGPLEVGATSCDDAVRMSERDAVVANRSVDAFTGGTQLDLGERPFGVDYAERVLLSCDGDDSRVESIHVVVPHLDVPSAVRELEAAHIETDRSPLDRGQGNATFFSSSGRSLGVLLYQGEAPGTATLSLMSRYYLNMTNGGEYLALNPAQDTGEIALGPIEIGVTSCDDALDLAGRTGVLQETGTSEVSGARKATLGAAPFGQDHVTGAELHCDPTDSHVDAVLIQVDDADLARLVETFDRAYRRVRFEVTDTGQFIAAHCSDTHESCTSLIRSPGSNGFSVMLSTMDHAKRGMEASQAGR
ncbi:hypothetical protein [uncultured Algimonas sp.]|uniref:hypothetical protein n=1 Tax=uncultured Algimonas sp. TaxID=1547920 RepID=UPI00260CEEAA|nr:hypothetical protein [uncultured Algimonas sp.]